ncbi:alpha/beta fold hydrolase [Streptomyces sp. NPDC091209]|uniref:alpha/beta fold hydrolase n=1 Tax=Streptomyces sp. NPDC091209 TaxID=3365974 RepID=UPI00380AAEE8
MTPPGLRVFDGDAASAAVVLVHGIRVSSSMWLPHARRLAPDFRVSAPDLPGHGALHGGTFTLAVAVEALDAAVAEADAATGRRPLVVGMSLGGFVAMAHAATRPGHLRGLLVCGSTARARGWKALAYTAAAHIDERRSEEHSTEANARLFRRHATPECAEVCGALPPIRPRRPTARSRPTAPRSPSPGSGGRREPATGPVPLLEDGSARPAAGEVPEPWRTRPAQSCRVRDRHAQPDQQHQGCPSKRTSEQAQQRSQ